MKSLRQIKVEGLFLDYDGTISPINVTREKSLVSHETEAILYQIKQLVPVGIITTKDMSFIVPRTPFANAWCAISGLEMKIGDRITIDPDAEAALSGLWLALEYARYCSNNRLLIEEKRVSTGQTIAFCIDWRQSQNPNEAKTRATKIMAYCHKLPLNVVKYEGQPFFDVYPCHIDKGKALRELKQNFKLQGGVIYMGDSKVDNPAFKVADIGIGVLHKESAADLDCNYYIKFENMSRFLQRLKENDMVFYQNFPEITQAQIRTEANVKSPMHLNISEK